MAIAAYTLPLKEAGKATEDRPDDRAGRIDEYFRRRQMPLAGFGIEFIEAADRCDLDWRLLPAIAVKESQGGRYLPRLTWNPFGWKSGLAEFDSFEEAIEYVGRRLCDSPIYRGKKTKGILRTYNPPRTELDYPEKVMRIMNELDKE